MKEIFSSGGGVQSSCIAALIVQGRLPKPDLAIIADTTRERSEVWEYLERVVKPELQAVGVPFYRVSTEGYGYAGRNLFNKAGSLLIPAFSTRDAGDGKLKNYCSTYWKIEAIDNFLSREMGIKRQQYRKWIGFSLDEAARYTRMKVSKEGAFIRFPLIEDVPIRRQDALKIVEKMGWPTPPRSACWMCPNQGDHEWRGLKTNHPDEFQKAVELEHEIQKKDPEAWLHVSRIPLDQVDFTEPEDLFKSSGCNSGVCFT